MSRRYGRPVAPVELGSRIERQSFALGSTLLVLAALAWFVSHAGSGTSGEAPPAIPIVVTLLPVPPAPPPPPPHRTRHEHKLDERRRRRPAAAAAGSRSPRDVAAPVDLFDGMQPAIAMKLPDVALVPLPAPADTQADAEGQDRGHGGSAEAEAGAGAGSGGRPDDIGRLQRASWVWQPTDSALQPFFPKIAAARRMSGKTLIACRVRLTFEVHDCRIVAETATGVGFGEAAITASRIFRVYPPRRKGRPIDDAWVAIPVAWIYS